MVDPGTAAIIAGGIGALSGFMEDDEAPIVGNLDPTAAYKSILGTRSQTSPLFAQLEQLLRSQYGMVDKGIGRQKSELSMSGLTAKRQLLDREQQLKSDILQRSARSGLSSVTQPMNFRGLSHQTGLGMASIQEQLGQQFAGLEGQRLQQNLGITGQLAKLGQGRISQEQRFGELFAHTQFSNLNPWGGVQSPFGSGIQGALAYARAQGGGTASPLVEKYFG